MKLRTKSFVGIGLALIIMISMAGCGATPTPTPIPIDTPEPTPSPTPVPPSAPTLNQSPAITLEAGAQIPVNASSEGASSYSWSLQGDGEISTDTGPAVIYTAPDGEGGVAILSVTAYNESGLSSQTTNLTINIQPGKITLKRLEINIPKMGDTLIANQKTDCEGTYELSHGSDPTGIYVWILVGDDYGNYYLQNPPVSFKNDGTWSASIQPGDRITKIFVMQVTEEGNDFFNRRVAGNEFSGLKENDLPYGTIKLHSINIQT